MNGHGTDTSRFKVEAVLNDAGGLLYSHHSKQRSEMASKEICQSLSWLLEQVAMGVAQVIELGTMQQNVLLVFCGCC